MDLGLSDHCAQMTSVIDHTELKQDSLMKLMFKNFFIY